jgi:hypothetical protein
VEAVLPGGGIGNDLPGKEREPHPCGIRSYADQRRRLDSQAHGDSLQFCRACKGPLPFRAEVADSQNGESAFRLDLHRGQRPPSPVPGDIDPGSRQVPRNRSGLLHSTCRNR